MENKELINVQITYKSGARHYMRVTEFSTNVHNVTGALTEVAWKGRVGTYPLYINLSAVESVYVVDDE